MWDNLMKMGIHLNRIYKTRLILGEVCLAKESSPPLAPPIVEGGSHGRLR